MMKSNTIRPSRTSQYSVSSSEMIVSSAEMM
jgi:hypothetical protein